MEDLIKKIETLESKVSASERELATLRTDLLRLSEKYFELFSSLKEHTLLLTLFTDREIPKMYKQIEKIISSNEKLASEVHKILIEITTHKVSGVFTEKTTTDLENSINALSEKVDANKNTQDRVNIKFAIASAGGGGIIVAIIESVKFLIASLGA